jgi:hypothetical protein
MAAISLFWYTNMAAVTSDENDLYGEASCVSSDTLIEAVRAITYQNNLTPKPSKPT